MPKTASKVFVLRSSLQKLPFFTVLMNALHGHPRYFKFKQKYQQYGPCLETIVSFLMNMIYIVNKFKFIYHLWKGNQGRYVRCSEWLKGKGERKQKSLINYKVFSKFCKSWVLWESKTGTEKYILFGNRSCWRSGFFFSYQLIITRNLHYVRYKKCTLYRRWWHRIF